MHYNYSVLRVYAIKEHFIILSLPHLVIFTHTEVEYKTKLNRLRY